MATRVVTIFDDDLDGTPAAETVSFALDSTQYTIDLSSANAAKLRAALGPYMLAASRTSSSTPPRARRPTRIRSTADNARLRTWARAAGYQVLERGRIRQDVVDAYHAAAPTGPEAVMHVEQPVHGPGPTAIARVRADGE